MLEAHQKAQVVHSAYDITFHGKNLAKMDGPFGKSGKQKNPPSRKRKQISTQYINYRQQIDPYVIIYAYHAAPAGHHGHGSAPQPVIAASSQRKPILSPLCEKLIRLVCLNCCSIVWLRLSSLRTI